MGAISVYSMESILAFREYSFILKQAAKQFPIVVKDDITAFPHSRIPDITHSGCFFARSGEYSTGEGKKKGIRGEEGCVIREFLIKNGEKAVLEKDVLLEKGYMIG
jgi:hypothetical protein